MLVFDGHSDLLYDVTRRRLLGERCVLDRCHEAALRRGGVAGLLLALWSGTGQEGFWPEPNSPQSRLEQMLSCTRAEQQECSSIALVKSWKEAETARAKGQIAAFLGIEGMDGIGRDLSALDRLYQAGVRTGMLTWNGENALASGVSGTGGLTTLGRQAVRRMQGLGMLLDVSHLNEAGFWDVMGETQGPILASHSNCRALCDVPRNLWDDQLRAIRDTGGLVGLNAYAGFVHPDPQRQTVEQLALHAAHLVEVMGISHVACGFDFCGYMGSGNESAAGLAEAGEIPRFFSCLQRLGMTRREQEAIAWGNLCRLLQDLKEES